MDKASAYRAGGCRLEPCRGHSPNRLVRVCVRACARAHVPSHEGWAMELPSWTSPKLPPEIPGRFSHHVTTSLEQPRRFLSIRSEGCQKGFVWTFTVAKSIPEEFKVAGCGVLKWPEKAGDIRWRRRFTPKLARHLRACTRTCT